VFGTSASRRASLPRDAWKELRSAAAVCVEDVVLAREDALPPEVVVYSPDLVSGASAPLAPTPPRAPQPPTVDLPVYGRAHFESLFASRRYPWDYESEYEQVKYSQTLSLVPTGVDSAIEVGCAEGHFTKHLATRVDSLVAADISRVALDRAATRCAGLPNVKFQQLDLTKDAPRGTFELVVCSELLYYVGDVAALRKATRRLADAILAGGHLLTSHTNLLVDDPQRPGFDWGLPFGARVIGETFEQETPLRLVKEIQTPLYRVQLFNRPRRLGRPRRAEILEMEQPTPVPPDLEELVRWNGGVHRAPYLGQAVETHALPILMYHRVADRVEGPLAPYTVTPHAFEEQLMCLADSGYGSASLDDWRAAVDARQPLPGRAVILTFDDGYLDFSTNAWPLLQKHGFGAIVFLVADLVGKTNEWDRGLGVELPLMDWDAILRLQEEGAAFGAHSATHPALTGLTNVDIVREAARAREVLRTRLGTTPAAFAYPYGDVDPAVAQLIGGSGYAFGLTCEARRCSVEDSLLLLPRIEVDGAGGLADFVANLNAD
jgi:peptidoglycan/xylan/chitin deacetylase (PgdA/CDA1 family)